MHTRRWWSVILPVIALLTTLAIGTLVGAHAQLKTATPADKATVATAPAQVVLTFREETSATQSNGAVMDASGATVSTGFKVDLNDRTKMTIDLKPNLPAGVYTVKFHTLTEDDNGMVDGTTTFTVQAAAAGTSTTGTSTVASGSPVAAATAAATATSAPTATRAATSAVATGTGGVAPATAPATLPQTGRSAGGAMFPWVMLVALVGAAAVAVGVLFRARTWRS